MAVMNPDIGHDVAAEGAAALRDFILVMREDEVDAAAVDIEGFAQMLPAHRRAFEMPAGPATAPRAVPAGLVGSRGFPEHEVLRVSLVGRDFDTGAGDQLVQRPIR